MTQIEPSTLATSMANPIACFETYQEADDIKEYFERLELFFEVQKVVNDSKVAHLFSCISSKTYSVLKNLSAPRLPAVGTIKDFVGAALQA